MSWFDASGLTSLAKSALKEAQKTIDKALDIQDEMTTSETAETSANADDPGKTITESPSRVAAHSIWGSFTGSFFETPKEQLTSSFSDDLHRDESFNRSKLVVHSISDDSGATLSRLNSENQSDVFENNEKILDYISKTPRQSEGSINRLSLVSVESGKNSSESLEILGSHSLKSTPDSDTAFSSSNQSISSSSTSTKLNSESVGVLPLTPLSDDDVAKLPIEVQPATEHKKQFENFEFAAAADDDEDTISYNSVSESTAPTILDSDYPITKPPARSTAHIPQILQSTTFSLSSTSINFAESCTSSNDGSLSDRTLNADTMESSADEILTKRDNVHTDDCKSDSSSFCNVACNESYATTRKDSSVSSFEAVEKISHSELEIAAHVVDCQAREQTSPNSSESRSDLVKIGSEQTSEHTSGDENETTTSSDIEIIPSPNGDPGSIYRQSPAKIPSRGTKANATANVVDLVLGKSLATKVRGHNRELSEGSNQSMMSDDSHCSENERLLKRLSEMAEILESREKKLIEVSRLNIDLTDNNSELKMQIESLQTKDSCDISLITDEYTQRLSALEKKFQQAIREKDIMRKQIDTLKQEAAVRNSSSDLEKIINERDEVIKDLREEGEKLSKQQLLHTNIIRKLRTMEKDNEQVIKTLRDKIAEQNQELDKCKKSLTAKEFTECSQIEAVYKLTTANKKLETDLVETKGLLDDANHRLETTKTSLEAARKELKEFRDNSQTVAKRKEAMAALENEKSQIETENDQIRAQLDELRMKTVQDERRWVQREERLRSELRETAARAAEAEASADGPGGPGSPSAGGGPLLAQLASLQQSALTRDRQHQAQLRRLQTTCSDLQSKLSKYTDVERLLREECDLLRSRLQTTDASLVAATHRVEEYVQNCSEHASRITELENEIKMLSSKLEAITESTNTSVEDLEGKLKSAEQHLRVEKASCEAEKRRNALLQEQLKETTMQHSFTHDSFNPGLTSSVLLPGDVSPPHSVGRDSLASELLGSSVWPMEDGSRSPPLGTSTRTMVTHSTAVLAPVVENLQAAVKQREGELKLAGEAAKRYQTEKDALNSEVARLTAELDNLQTLQHQYDALLQMYGEKEEQLQELRLDLQDVKDMYKMQLDEILMLKKQAAHWASSRS